MKVMQEMLDALVLSHKEEKDPERRRQILAAACALEREISEYQEQLDKPSDPAIFRWLETLKGLSNAASGDSHLRHDGSQGSGGTSSAQAR